MYRGTTPTITLKLNTDFDFDNIKQIWFTVATSAKKLTKTLKDVTINSEKSTISVNLTQEETLMFAPGTVSVQARILTNDGEAFATPIKTTTISQVLEGGVING
jgi:hypothetical protein